MTVNNFNVLVGTNSLNQGGYRHLVQDFIMHENYDANMAANDIGLIRVLIPIQFNDRVQPVPLSPQLVPENVALLVSGWGRLRVKMLNFLLNFT